VHSLNSELEVMQVINHPNIVNIVDMYQDEKRVCLVYELMEGGELFNQLDMKYSVSEQLVQDLVAPLFDAIMYCHDLGIVHRDLKPENLLLTDSNL